LVSVAIFVAASGSSSILFTGTEYAIRMKISMWVALGYLQELSIDPGASWSHRNGILHLGEDVIFMSV
jgi:hypothetical protein